MRAFILSKNGVPMNTNYYTAWLGFKEMGVDVVPYSEPKFVNEIERDDIVVGGMGMCHKALEKFEVELPHINYPGSLSSFLGRRIWFSTINEVNNDVESWPLFVKPVEDKRFTGVAVRRTADLVGCGTSGENAAVICSEIVDFVAEWRCYVRYGEILGVKLYRGDWGASLDSNVVKAAVAAYQDAPTGYGIDFGLTADGRTLLVEVNDGYSLGNYGLQHNLYAQLLSARWSELMGVDDPFGYIGKHESL